jgi:16S rRNA G966 N2-methylase RsmD
MIGWEPSCTCHLAEADPLPTRPCLVLDPFGGSGTTGMVASRMGRSYVLCELSPKYVEIAKKRIASVSMQKLDAKPEDAPLFNQIEATPPC